MQVVTAAEMREIEAVAVRDGDRYELLMERAGESVARITASLFGHLSAPKVLVMSGPGNNGGDALVVARHLHDRGWAVRCRTWARSAAGDERLREPLVERDLVVTQLESDTQQATVLADIKWCDLVVDGLLGTGIERDVAGELARLVDTMNASGRPVVAIDLPTGVSSDTGAIRGAAIRATVTVALGHLKYGHLLHPGAAMSGDIRLEGIGLDTSKSKAISSGTLLDEAFVRELLPERAPDANKGTFGKVMVVAGSVNYIGAARLAVEGAMRSGAGLVTLACPGDLLPMMASRLTESTFLLLPSDMGSISSHALEKLRAALAGYTALVVGCGIGQDKETTAFVKALLSSTESTHPSVPRPMGFSSRPREEQREKDPSIALPSLVLDGDALGILASLDNWVESVPTGSVLTPHPGEMSKLLGSTVEEVQGDRVSAAKSVAKKARSVVVLKGAATLIADPGGKLFVSPFSNPALATAGTGDVLAGLIGGLLAQGLSPLNAACAGVYLHGMAGELLREEYGVAGGLAGDLPVLVARAQKQLRGA